MANKEKYLKSAHLVYLCRYHVIFCPRYRHKLLTGVISDRVKEICFEVAISHNFVIEAIETDLNHVHLIINCNPRFGITHCIGLLKSATGYYLISEFKNIVRKKIWKGGFWSRSTFIATVGSVSLEVVKAYVENQGKNSLKTSRK